MSPLSAELTAESRTALLHALRARFHAHPQRHPALEWAQAEARLLANPAALWSLAEMERTGGEPDVIGAGSERGDLLFCDCSAESPAGRRSLCYDPESLASRRQAKPIGSAVGMAASMGIELLTEQQYRALQQLGAFDLKTSSWIKTPAPIRSLGGALFCDRRYDHVFAYHNGAESYYAARGFRGALSV